MSSQIAEFLQDKLLIPADSLALAQRQSEGEPHQLPMVLWQYGLITLEQLELLFDWLETVC